jgi:hypothetical protein
VSFASPHVKSCERLFGHELGATWVSGGNFAEFSTTELQFATALPKVEIISPRGEGFISRFLKRHGPGVHHITFVTEDLRLCDGNLRRHGFEPWLTDFAGDTWHQVVLHPKTGLGTVIQIGRVVGAPFRSQAPPRFTSSRCRARVATVVVPSSAYSHAQILFRDVLAGRPADGAAHWQEYEWHPGGARLRVVCGRGENQLPGHKPQVEIAVAAPCSRDELRRLGALCELAVGPRAVRLLEAGDGNVL